MYDGCEETKNGDDRNEMVTQNEWLTPKKGVTMTCVCEMQKKNENKNMNNNKHKELSCDEEKDEDEEHHAMVKDMESSTVASNDKKCKRKVINSDVDESDNKEACKVAECEGDFKK